MLYRDFKRQNDLAKKYISNVGTVSDVDLVSGTCTLTVGDRVTKNLGIHNIVSDIVYNGMGAITNPSAFKNWKGFK